ncbi:hypothetical protein SLE2022_318270 [Rubroshorea leprosula]
MTFMTVPNTSVLCFTCCFLLRNIPNPQITKMMIRGAYLSGTGNGSQAVVRTSSTRHIQSFWRTGSSFAITKIVHNVFQELKINVMVSNISQLSECRKDAQLIRLLMVNY